MRKGFPTNHERVDDPGQKPGTAPLFVLSFFVRRACRYERPGTLGNSGHEMSRRPAGGDAMRLQVRRLDTAQATGSYSGAPDRDRRCVLAWLLAAGTNDV